MKKKEILRRLKYVDSSNYKNPVNPFAAIKQLIDLIEKDMKPEREYLKPLQAITKLLNGEARKVTNEQADDDEYVTLHQGALAWFKNEKFVCYQVDLIDEFKWWVVE